MKETPEVKRRCGGNVIRCAVMSDAMTNTLGTELSVSRTANMPRRTLRTVDAARYLGVSPSLLRKYRAMGRGDPGLKGPAFIKISPSIVLYEICELDRWLDARRVGGGAAE